MAETEFRAGALRSYEYDADTRTLLLRFKNGRLSRYADVPQDVVDALVASEPGTGSFVAHHIRGQFEVIEA